MGTNLYVIFTKKTKKQKTKTKQKKTTVDLKK